MSTRKIEYIIDPEPHRCKSIISYDREISVDIAVLPIVQWINQFDGLRTTFSCAGDRKTKGQRHLPYVSFVGSREDTRKIEKMVRHFALKHKFRHEIWFTSSRYYIRGEEFDKSHQLLFPTRRVMKMFIKDVVLYG